MDKVSSCGVLPGDELGELFDKRNNEVARDGNGCRESGKIKKFGPACCADSCRSNGGNDARFGFSASESGFEIEKELDRCDVGKEWLDAWREEETIEERHEKSVIFSSLQQNDFVRVESVR